MGKVKISTDTVTSIDGTRTITVEEFDRLFDDASDEIDQFIDWSKARRVGSAMEVRVGRITDDASSQIVSGQPPKDAAG
jgi:hypothetical protein